MTITRTQVVANARYHERVGTYWGYGQCLKFARTCAGAPGGVYDANAAWANARFKHRMPDAGPAPAGTFVFWAGGDHGHVAVSTGDGRCVSTDVLRYGRVDEVQIREITLGWGYILRGWTEDINGVHPTDDQDWFDMATKAELREVVDNALAAYCTADNPAFVNAVRVAIEAERPEDAQAAVDKFADSLDFETPLRTRFRQNVRVPVDAELTQRGLGT